jgi:hypothetical protein
VGWCKSKTKATEAALHNFNHKIIAQIMGIVGYQAFSTIVQDAMQLEKGCCRPFHQSIHCQLPTNPLHQSFSNYRLLIVIWSPETKTLFIPIE